jgi:nitroimidazol reductase NimA-like FMN-containing flavoprotein (pyridoxamine 5'-phosphate oxidase superfamily)
MVSDLDRHVCWICGRVVVLDNCKTDEQGFAVHQACNLARLALNKEGKPGSKIPPMPTAYRFKLDMRFAKRL